MIKAKVIFFFLVLKMKGRQLDLNWSPWWVKHLFPNIVHKMLGIVHAHAFPWRVSFDRAL